MPVLPLVDLLILLGSSSLLAGFLLKAVYVTTHYRPTLLGFTAFDCLTIAGVCMLLALTLSARTWVKLNEPKLLRLRSRRRAAEQGGNGEYEHPDQVEGLESTPALARPIRHDRQVS